MDDPEHRESLKVFPMALWKASLEFPVVIEGSGPIGGQSSIPSHGWVESKRVHLVGGAEPTQPFFMVASNTLHLTVNAQLDHPVALGASINHIAQLVDGATLGKPRVNLLKEI